MYILTADLAPLLGLKPDGFLRWPAALKPPTITGRRHRYADVNVWLAARARGFANPPTIEQLISGEITLVLTEVAAPQLTEGLSIRDPIQFTWRRIAKGRLESVLVRPRTWVVTTRSVQRLALEWQQAEDLTMEEMRRVFGFGRSATFYRLVERGELEVVKDPVHAHRIRVTRQSANNLLRTLLERANAPIEPEDWLEDRLRSSEPLVTVRQAARQLVITYGKARELLRDGTLLYIPSPQGSKWFVSPESIAECEKQEQLVTAIDQAAVFGVKEDDARKWRHGSRFLCAAHPHKTPNATYRRCLVQYLQQGRIGPGVDAVDWVARAIEYGAHELLTKEEVVEQELLTSAELDKAVAAGRVPMIVRPSRVKVYGAAAVSKEAGK